MASTVCFFISQSLTVCLVAASRVMKPMSAKTGGQVANAAVRKEMWLSLAALSAIDDADPPSEPARFVLLRNG